MWQGIAVLVALLGADDVTIQPLQGSVARGTLVALTPQNVVIRSAAGEMTWPVRNLLSIRPGRKDSPPATESKSSAYFVEITDGSLIIGDDLSLAAGKVALVRDGQTWEIPSRVVRSIRLRRPNDSVHEQWTAIAAAPVTGDQLVVRKVRSDGPDSGPATVALDQLEGVIRGMSPAGIAFEFDGDPITVAWEKVEGVVFHQSQVASWPDPVCQVRDARGGEWRARSVAFSEGRLRLETLAGIAAELRWNQVAELDFTAGNLQFLSDLTPESVDWRPYVVTPTTPPALATWFNVRRDQKADGSVLMLGGQSYEKGLAIHSRTTLSYRLTRDFRHFQGVAGIDERFRGTANLRLVITGDDRTLLSRDIRGGDEPFEFDLDVAGVRRLRILVDFGEDRSDAGDHLLLCHARLTK